MSTMTARRPDRILRTVAPSSVPALEAWHVIIDRTDPLEPVALEVCPTYTEALAGHANRAADLATSRKLAATAARLAGGPWNAEAEYGRALTDLAVRSLHDPAIARLVTVHVGPREAALTTDQAKRIAAPAGYIGHPGGWVHRDGARRPLAQGWRSALRRLVNRGSRVRALTLEEPEPGHPAGVVVYVTCRDLGAGRAQ